MPCFGPSVGYYSAELNATGRRSIVFSPKSALPGPFATRSNPRPLPIAIPCGECIGCLMSWRRQWATRCVHELRLHRESAFVTLTYEDRKLPAGGSLSKRDLQLFMKRLRLARPAGLRFFACGEYGETTARPHYHLLLFNACFPDQRQAKISGSGEPLYRSTELGKLWSVGDHYIGSVTPQSCAYVAGYVLKKVGQSGEEYARVGLAPEFRLMSRRPGVGSGWFDRYQDEAYRHDSAILDGHEVPLPRFYDARYALIDPKEFERLRRERKRRALFEGDRNEHSRERMFVRERFQLLKQARFKRDGG